MIELINSSLRLSTPLLFAALGGLLCERAGIATICLEGVMLNSAFTAAAVNFYSHNPWLAMLAAVVAGAMTMLLHAFLCITARANHIISGVAVNILAAGLTPILTKSFFGSPTNSAAIPLADRFQIISLPLLQKIPILGPIFFEQLPLVYLALMIPFLVHYFILSTGAGLRLLAAGDGPDALATAGVSVSKVRYAALIAGGAVASFGGTYLSISHSSSFTRDMTAGRGFIALAALIFGKWRPLPTLFACLFFGLTDAAQIQLQSATLFGLSIPVQFVQALPYVMTLIVLAGFIGKARPPLAITNS